MLDPSIGRWFEEDPEGFDAGDANLFRYVGNDPTNETDPSGTQAARPAPWGSTAQPIPPWYRPWNRYSSGPPLSGGLGQAINSMPTPPLAELPPIPENLRRPPATDRLQIDVVQAPRFYDNPNLPRPAFPNRPECGSGVEYVINWRMRGEYDGWIIQKVTYTVNLTFNPNHIQAATLPVYWEAWRVRGGRVYGRDEVLPSPEDIFRTPHLPDNTGGTITSRGEFVFISGNTLDMRQFRRNIPGTGGLLATRQEPAWWRDYERRTYDHVLIVSWHNEGGASRWRTEFHFP